MDLMSMTIFSRMPQLTILLKPLGVATLADRSVDGFNRPQIWAQDMGPRSCLAWTSRRGRCLHASTTPLINALQFWLAHALWRAQFPRSEPHLPRSEPHRPKRRCSCGARSGAPNDDSDTKGCLRWETIAAPPFVEETIGAALARAAQCVTEPIQTLRKRASWGRDPRGYGRVASVSERIWTQLKVHDLGQASLAAFHEPWSSIATGGPQAAALPSRICIIDAPIESLGVEAQWIGYAQHDHFTVLEGDEAVVEVAG